MKFSGIEIRKGQAEEAVRSEIERDYIDFLTNDYYFLYYHDLETDVRDYRLIKDPKEEQTIEIMKRHEDLLEGFSECVHPSLLWKCPHNHQNKAASLNYI